MKKETFIEYANNTFKDKALELVLKNIDLFFDDIEIKHQQKYKLNDEVTLKRGTFLHGIPGYIENFDWIVENGFLAVDFTGKSEGKNKIKNSIGMWNIQEDISLKDYITSYSGFTITYTIGRGPGSKKVSELVPYHMFDNFTEELNNRDDVWTYWGEKTKEVTFLPSLVSDKRQIAFILNMESEYAQELSKADVWNIEYDEETLKEFLDYRYLPQFIELRFNKDATSTDREVAIMFGLPIKLVEGVFVGRKLENDQKALLYIKNKLPHCYICNLNGKVIVE